MRQLREEAGYTNQGEFAERLGVSGSQLSRMESGQRAISTLDLRRAAEIVGVSMDAFFAPAVDTVVLARPGEAEDPAMDEMVSFARELRTDLDAVAAYGAAE